MKIHKTAIPPGLYCYFNSKTYCPFFKKTDHGTIRCDYLNLEGVDYNQEDNYDLALQYFGSDDELEKQAPLQFLWDAVKECNENDDIDESIEVPGIVISSSISKKA